MLSAAAVYRKVREWGWCSGVGASRATDPDKRTTSTCKWNSNAADHRRMIWCPETGQLINIPQGFCKVLLVSFHTGFNRCLTAHGKDKRLPETSTSGWMLSGEENQVRCNHILITNTNNSTSAQCKRPLRRVSHSSPSKPEIWGNQMEVDPSFRQFEETQSTAPLQTMIDAIWAPGHCLIQDSAPPAAHW